MDAPSTPKPTPPPADKPSRVLHLNNDVWTDGADKRLTGPTVQGGDRFDGTAASHIGLVKKCNEDACIVDNDHGVYIVCDGLGGHAAGEVASHLAATTAYMHILEQRQKNPRIFSEPTEQDAINLITGALGAANGVVWSVAQSKPKSSGMATTIVMAVSMGTHMVVAHVGDSRAYLVRQGACHRLTDDHTVMAAMSKWAFDPTGGTPRRGLGGQLMRALGFYNSVQVDVLFCEVADYDRFVLMTDGVTDMIEESHVVKTILDTPTEQLAAKFVELANTAGGRDNVTVVTASVKPHDPPRRIAIRKVQVLQKMPLFAQLDYVEAIRVLNSAGGLAFKKGEVIVREGDTDQRLFILLTGAVDIRKNGTTVTTLKEMDFFGEMSLIDGEPRSADVVGAADGGMLVFSRNSIESLLTVEPALAVRVLWPLCQLINQRLRATSQQLAECRDGK